MADGLCPLVCVNVKFFLFRLSAFFLSWLFLSWRLLLTLFTLNWQPGLLDLHRPFQMNLFLNKSLFLSLPDRKVSNLADILFNPVQVFAHKLIFCLTVIRNNYISFTTRFCYFFSLLQIVNRQIDQATVVSNCYVLVYQSWVALDQEHSRLENWLEQLFCQNHCLAEIHTVNQSVRTDFVYLFDWLILLFNGLLDSSCFLFSHFSSKIGLSFLSLSIDELIFVNFKVDESRSTKLMNPIPEIIVSVRESIDQILSVCVFGKEVLKMSNDFSDW